MRLCVLTDIFGHLNKLNLLLQGRHELLCNLYEAVKGFEDKVTLFKVHAEGGNFLHLKSTRELCGEDDERITDANRKLADFNSLETEFSGQFADFAASLQALLLQSQLFAKHCRKRLQSTKQRCRTISSISRWCHD